MNEFEDFYRENILDHYKNPRNYGLLERAHDQVSQCRGPAIRRGAASPSSG